MNREYMGPLGYMKEYFGSEEGRRNLPLYGEAIDDHWKWATGQESVYERAEREENERYWADYERNTGITPLYPIRAGMERNRPEQHLPVVSAITGPMKQLYGRMK